MKRLFLTAAIVISHFFVEGQPPLTLDSCYSRAREQYPLIKQKDLIEKTKEFNISNASKGYLPQVSFNGQATYQSAVTSIPIAFKIGGQNITIPTLPKDQFNVHGEVDQTIYDGGIIKQQKESHNVNAEIQQQNIEVQLYALKDRINQIFFGALLIDEQIKQNELTQKDIQSSIDKIKDQINNGTALISSLDELQASILQQQQNEIGLKASRKAYLDMLGLFINQTLDDKTVLQSPVTIKVSETITRPELSYFEIQKKNDDVQSKILSAGNRPKFLYFFQGGYGLPGLNAFDINPALYYITGFRLSWALGGYYTLKNQRQLLDIDRQSLDIQREDFLFNTHITLKQQNTDITKLQQMITIDNDIISKRIAIKNSAKSQMENGVVTIHEYVNQLDAEDQAKQALLLHQIQLLLAEYSYQNTTGN